jgi:hypothetical protein
MDFIGRLALAGLLTLIMQQAAIAQHLRWDDNEMIRQAVVEAERRLEQPRCRRVLGDEATQALLTANYRVFSLGKPQQVANGKFQLSNATTIRELRLIVVNADGSFINPSLKAKGVRFNYGMTPLNLRAMIILHELGHLIGRFAHDADDPVHSKAYTDLIRESCF